MSVRKITFAKIGAAYYVNRETGVEIIRATASDAWVVWSPTFPHGRAVAGSRAHFRDARVFALIVALGVREAIAAAYIEAAASAQRDQATAAYQHFADAGRGAGGYRAALDILHAEALAEDNARTAARLYDVPLALLHGPTAEERPNNARAHAIAAIHALADFYAAHPEIPAPWSVRAHSAAADLDELRSLADTHGAKVYGRDPLAQQFDITVRDRVSDYDPATGIIVSVQSPPERPL